VGIRLPPATIVVVWLAGRRGQKSREMSSESNSTMRRTIVSTVLDPAGRFNHAW
jgi:hypothetical protein